MDDIQVDDHDVIVVPRQRLPRGAGLDHVDPTQPASESPKMVGQIGVVLDDQNLASHPVQLRAPSGTGAAPPPARERRAVMHELGGGAPKRLESVDLKTCDAGVQNMYLSHRLGRAEALLRNGGDA